MRNLVAGLILLAACSSPAEPSNVWQQPLDDARDRWAKHGPANYVYQYSRQCFCIPFAVEVEVRDGRVASVRDMAADTLFALPLPDLTIPHLFTEIQEFIDRGPHELTVTYGSVTAAPVQFAADPIEAAVDEEYGVTTSAFRALP